MTAETKIANPETTTLNFVERRALEKHEATIERGAKTFVEVGAAIMAIRDEHLYRGTHGTFDDYVSGRWGWARRYAYYLIDSARVCTMVHDVPNERVARELAPLIDKPEVLKAAWGKAVERSAGPVPTAKEVAAVVAKLSPKPKPRAAKPDADEYQLTVDDVMAQWKHYRDQIGQLVDDTAATQVLTSRDRAALWKSCVEPMIQFLDTLRIGAGT